MKIKAKSLRMNERDRMNERHNEIIINETLKKEQKKREKSKEKWSHSLFCFTYLSSMNSK